MRRSSLPFKLRAAFVLPTLAALAVSSPLAWLMLTDLIQKTATTQILSALPIIEPAVLQTLGGEPIETQAGIVELGVETSLRITLIRYDGTVLADSDRTWEQVGAMDNHAGRPEVLDANAKGEGYSVRRSATAGLDYLYAARIMTSPSYRPMILRLAQPLDQLAALKLRLSQILLLATAAALATLGCLVWLYNRRLSEPAAELIDGVRRLEHGDYSVRVDLPGERELAPAARFLNRFAEKANERIEDLEVKIERLRNLIAGIHDGVLVTDEEGFIWLTNPAFRDMFGISDEVEGRTPLELTRDRRLEDLVVRTLANAESQSEQVEIHHPDRRHLALASTFLEDGPGAVVLARDVTELVHLTQMRQDFIANLSHELKTPLSAIRGFAETLIDGAVEDKETAERFLRRILQQCHRLQLLLEDLLTLSTLENLERRAETQSVNLGDAVRECLEILAQDFSDKRIALEVEEAERLPRIAGDRESLERMVLNLLSNAVKYNTDRGRVSIRLEQEESEVLLEVADSGIGIPGASLPRVFERFYRVDKARSREAGGTGLGLAIVKHAAQLHGGRVSVESQIGKGSIFRVYLPGQPSA